jgi:hypothetical protein
VPKCLNLLHYSVGDHTCSVVVKRDGKWDDEPVALLSGYPVPRKGDVIDLDHPEIEEHLVVVDVIWHIRDEYAPDIEVRAEKMSSSYKGK